MNGTERRLTGWRVGIGMWALFSGSAFAYETDQVSLRHLELPDVQGVLDDYMDEMLEQVRIETMGAIDRNDTNEEIADRFRSELYEVNRMRWKTMGITMEKWMRDTLMPKYARSTRVIDELGREGRERSIYAQAGEFSSGFFDWVRAKSFSLGGMWTGDLVRPTYNAAGIRFGGDKLTHFFRLGYRYWKMSERGTRLDIPVAYGTGSENGGIGMKVIGVFSYADLAANYDGMSFYRDLFDGENPMFEVVRAGGDNRQAYIHTRRYFHLSEYINEDWDEYFNPPYYTKSLGEAVHAQLKTERSLFCTEYAQWSEASRYRQQPKRDAAIYIDLAHAPIQSDPFQIMELCTQPE